jgi:GNAT superfamily N-acetyltransferase
MTENPTVIGATLSDLPEFMRLFKIMHQENGMFDLDEDCVRETFNRAVKNKEGVIGLIKGPLGDLRAMLFLLVTRYYYTQQFHLEELFNFVAPEHRRTNYADALLKYADHCQKSLGIPLVIGVLTNSRMEAKVRKYRRHFGMPAGAFFVSGAPQAFFERTKDFELWRVHTRGRESKKENGLSAHLATTVATTLMMPLQMAGNA